MKLWRPGITGKLFLAIISTCLMALAIMHIATRLSFEYGFKDYIKRGNEQRLEWLSETLSDQYSQHGSWAFLQHNDRMIFQLLRTYDRNESDGRDMPPPPPHGLRAKFWVMDDRQNILVGPHHAPPPEGNRRAIVADGKTVGWVIASPVVHLTQNTDINFDRQQQRTSWIIIVLSSLLAAGVTFFLARGLLAPVKRLVEGTHRLAAGDFSARVTPGQNDELGRLAQDFNQLASTLEKNQQMRRAYMADISHELRTPLAVLNGELEAMQDGVRQFTPASLASLQMEVATLTKLVTDLHQLSLSDEGALDYHKSSLDIIGLLEVVAGIFRTRFADRKLTLRLDLPERAVVFGDSERLMQLFNNLLENSLRYTDAGGELRIEGRCVGEQLTLRFADSAPGVTDEQLTHLFNRFYRTEGSRNRASGGSGLGLSICQNIVTAHNGTLTASHSPSGGVMMTVTLPVDASLPR